MRLLRRRAPLHRRSLDAPFALRGPVWCGDGTSYDDGRVVVAADGTLAAFGPATATPLPPGAEEVEAGWIGPGLVDRHVHLAFADPDPVVEGGVVAVRDLGAPPADAARWRSLDAPAVTVAGPVLTAPGGYPSRSWGAAGFAAFVDDPEQTQRLVSGLATQVDVVKVALEPQGGGPVPSPEVVAAVVAAAHGAGTPVTAHALSLAMVERALEAGVDELAHTPVELLPDEVVARIAAAGTTVVSTLHTFVHVGDSTVLANAAALAAAGVALHYGTDLGNAGTRPGASPDELRLLADRVGLGVEGALRAATEPLAVGARAGVVALERDPRDDPALWRSPRVVVVGRTLLDRAAAMTEAGGG
jgi:imidazolonepropionase-like amidohydrolase